HICEYYIKKGVSCAVIDSKTPAAERQRIVDAYKASPAEGHTLPSPTAERQALDVLVNVDIFGEGFDVPEVEFIQLARPTLSLSKYLQQVGRGMRVSPGKPHVLILDNVGLYQTFGLPTDEHDWQRYFKGKAAGKGVQQSRPVVVRMDELGLDGIGQGQESRREKELVNLEMVHIKRRGEKHEGVEVILQDGLYGIMYNGSVTCMPRYERVYPLKDGGEFFALAEYPQKGMNGRRTVINYQGVDLQMALYGEVRREGDFFIGRNIRGEKCYWDGQGREYYKEMPKFRQCGGIDLKPFLKGRYRLRRWPNLFVNGLSVEMVYSNKNLVIIDNHVLIVKTVPQRAYTIFGYMGSSVLVNTSRGMMEIKKDGTTGSIMRYVPEGFLPYPNYYSMNLQAVT
ncbi:MAG: hypothetical protein IJ253_05165, partial [Bacteroidaceae bacterium]|nr:hypothetical protein [Bacteroidaceae bacterium]